MTIKLQREIAEDFGQPFREVVKGFAGDGYSIGGTARILEYPATSFRRYVYAKGWQGWFRATGNDCRNKQEALRDPNVTDKRREAARRNGQAAAERNANMVEYKGQRLSIADHARRFGINPKTARGRYRNHPDDLDYVFSQSLHYLRPGEKRCQTKSE